MTGDTVCYRVHGLVDVYVHAAVTDDLKENLDFQIGHFKLPEKPDGTAPHWITVRPFMDYSPLAGVPYEVFHLVRGIRGSEYVDPQGRVAYRKHSLGYEVWADYPSFLVNLFIQLLLLDHGIVLTHAAAYVDKEGAVTLIPGAGGVGKTAIVGVAVKELGCRLLGDDIVGLARDGTCYSFPRSFVLKEYHRTTYPEVFKRLGIPDSGGKREAAARRPGLGTRIARKGSRLVRENAPFVGISRALIRRVRYAAATARPTSKGPTSPKPYLAAVAPDVVFGKGSVAEKGDVRRIVFFKRYEGDAFRFEPLDEASLCNQMFAIILHEWVGVMRQFFALGALEIIDVPSYMTDVHAVMRQAVAGRGAELCLIPNGANAEETAAAFFKRPELAGKRR